MRRAAFAVAACAVALAACRGENAAEDAPVAASAASAASAPASASPATAASAVVPVSAPPAWPPDYLAHDVESRTNEVLTELGPGSAHVEGSLFVFAAPDHNRRFAETLDVARRALAIFESGALFERLPDRPVAVYVLGSTPSYGAFCHPRFGKPCDGELGLYEPNTRTIVLDVSKGTGTAVHELVHPFIQRDFPLAPVWLAEGIASLLEHPSFDPPGEIHGNVNWRIERLRSALASPSERAQARLDVLFQLGDGDFGSDGPVGLHYALARYAVMWLDSLPGGKLWPMYRAWRDSLADDRTGEKAFETVVGKTPAGAQSDWETWASSR